MKWMFALLLGLGWAATARAADLVGQLADGSRVEADEIVNWHEENSVPTIGGRMVLDPRNPCRWFVRTTQPLSTAPAAYVEFTGGDQLPGTVRAYQTGTESPWEHFGPHLVVEPAIDLYWPDAKVRPVVRVNPRWLKRIVWQGRGRDYRPGTVFFSDGRELGFRSVRWGQDAISLLTDDGIQTIGWANLSELHLPRQAPWEAYYEQLAALFPDKPGLAIQVETADGLKLTTCLNRYKPQFHGNPKEVQSWLPMIQPAWALDPLYVRFQSVRAMRFWQPHQVPLTLIEPTEVRQQSQFGQSWRWRLDRNSQGKSLRSAGQDFGWGIGVHASHEMTFELPPLVKSFTTKMGLDELSAGGGCVRAELLWNGQLRHRTDLLIGSGQLRDSSRIGLEDSGARQLTLRVDAAIIDRPEGADPLDIRDTFNWLEPWVELDEAKLAEEIRRRVETVPGQLADWKLQVGPASSLQVVNYWNDWDRDDPRWGYQLGVSGSFLTFRKRVKVEAGQAFLAVGIYRLNDREPKGRVHVRIDNRDAYVWEVKPGEQPDPTPCLLPLKAYQGKVVPVEVTLLADEKDFRVLWRAVEPVAGNPNLQPLFEDQLKFVELLQVAEGAQAHIVHEQSYAGAACLMLTPGELGAAQIPGWAFPIRETPQLGEYRYLRFAWKKPQGKVVALSLGHDGQLGTEPGKHLRIPAQAPRADGLSQQALSRRNRKRVDLNDKGMQFGYRYDAGSWRETPYGGAVRRLANQTPRDWTLQDVDLYNDFGNFTLTGLHFLNLEGSEAYLDHLYLARRRGDFDLIRDMVPKLDEPPKTDPNERRLAFSYRILDLGAAPAEAIPGFAAGDNGQEFWLLKEHRGKTNVFRTHPRDSNLPCVLAAPLFLPEGKKSLLSFAVGLREDNADWRLIVKANGQEIHNEIIDKTSAPEGWKEVNLDLSRFAGQAVMMELIDAAHGDGHNAAYWHGLRLTHPTQ